MLEQDDEVLDALRGRTMPDGSVTIEQIRDYALARFRHNKVSDGFHKPIPRVDTSECNSTGLHHLNREIVRRSTYGDTYSEAYIRRMAKSGLYRFYPRDQTTVSVKCAFCNVIIYNWRQEDDPNMKHSQSFPNCPLIKGMPTGNITAADDCVYYPPTEEGAVAAAACGGGTAAVNVVPAKHPSYASETTRLTSFSGIDAKMIWPKHTINSFVEAGLFYPRNPNHPDGVRCYYCDTGFANWVNAGNPMMEHVRINPYCPYLQDKVHQQLIQETKRLRPQSTTVEQSFTSMSPLSRTTPASNTDRSLFTLHEQKPPPTSHTTPSNDATLHASGGAAACGGAAANAIEDEDEEAARLIEENKQLSETRQCKVCMDSESNIVFLPCGHLVSCNSCAPELRTCPICRTLIRGTVKVFLS
jgi:hypothetical protein